MKKTGSLRIAAVIIIILLIIPIAFVAHFIISSYLIHSEKVLVDAVVVLTGGRGRVEEGIRLYKSNGSAYIVFLGVSPSVKTQDLFRGKITVENEAKVILEKNSRNTIENAIYGNKVLGEQGIRRFYLVTSRFHLKRAMFLFRRILPQNSVIYPYPVEDRNFTTDFSKNMVAFKLYGRETYKYWIYRMFFMITDDTDSISSVAAQK